MNAMGFRSLALLAGIGVSFATNANAVERSTGSAAKVQEEKTAFFGLPLFGNCNSGWGSGGCGYGSCQRPVCGMQPCYGRPAYGAYPVSGGYVRPYPYGVPAYSTPGYGVPAYGVPAYGVPGYGAPGYYGPYGAAAPVGVSPTVSPYMGSAPIINTSGYRSPVMPGALDDPYFP